MLSNLPDFAFLPQLVQHKQKLVSVLHRLWMTFTQHTLPRCQRLRQKRLGFDPSFHILICERKVIHAQQGVWMRVTQKRSGLFEDVAFQIPRLFQTALAFRGPGRDWQCW